jgi:hypothetical protein
MKLNSSNYLHGIYYYINKSKAILSCLYLITKKQLKREGKIEVALKEIGYKRWCDNFMIWSLKAYHFTPLQLIYVPFIL